MVMVIGVMFGHDGSGDVGDVDGLCDVEDGDEDHDVCHGDNCGGDGDVCGGCCSNVCDHGCCEACRGGCCDVRDGGCCDVCDSGCCDVCNDGDGCAP